MGNQLLVRNVPQKTRAWIDAQRIQYNMSQQEVVLSVLDQAVDYGLELNLPLFPNLSTIVERSVPENLPFTFVDLFAGIGGFRIALEKVGGRCLFSSEWDKYSQKTYKAWHGDMPHGDIREIKPADIPDHDILAAGFPCQPFSIAGVSKRNSLGTAHGFNCATQGNLFFQLATIIKAKRPPLLFLENVKNLRSHDNGRTWAVIQETLHELDYWIFSEVIDAAGWVPQHRERVYIVCFDKREFKQRPLFQFPKKPEGRKPRLDDILETAPDEKYTLTPHLWNYLQRYAESHKAKGNGFGFGLVTPEKIARTLSARYYKDGSEILIFQGNSKLPRRLTPKECARLMGFDEKYQEHQVVSDTQAYRQFGNAVVPKVVEAVARQIVKILAEKLVEKGCLLKRTEVNNYRVENKASK
ncbi:MAG: DNA (cytosine-5-)-methyltransferase [Holophagales bacterium]|nr:DNA (cytosine-5-)-methyltransferase [Holophagales bacterium]